MLSFRLGKAIPDTKDGFYVSHRFRIFVQFTAQVLDVGIDTALIPFIGISLGGFKQLQP
jgi:hypothetical protein